MEVRHAGESDVALLADINRQLIEDEWNGDPMSLEQLENRMRRWLAEGDYQALLFLESGTAVAYSLVSVDEDSAFIRHFFVFRQHRGRGVGRRAVEILVQQIIPPTARITLDVLASNRTGYLFWHSVGFADYAIRMERLPGSAMLPKAGPIGESAGA